MLGISPVHLLDERGCTWVLPSPTTEGQCPAARRYGCASKVGSGGGKWVFLSFCSHLSTC